MFSRPGFNIGDAWFFVENDIVHMFFLTAPKDSGRHWHIGHAVSEDLYNWEFHGEIARPESSWESKKLATGSVIKKFGKYWLAYTGEALGEDPSVGRIGLMSGDSIESMQRISSEPVLELDPETHEDEVTGSRNFRHWRDPFLYDAGEFVYMFICARRRDGDVSERGSVAVLRSKDMLNWESLGWLDHKPFGEELEVPQVYHINDQYYLLFGTHPQLIGRSIKDKFPGYNFRSGDYCMVSDSFLGPYRLYGTGEICSGLSMDLYASQLVRFKKKWYLLGTVFEQNDEQFISDPVLISIDETGIHARE